jgi:uncharacterized protein YukE
MTTGSGRVLSTKDASDAITLIKSIINNGLTEQLGQLDTQGQKLSQPDVWDGALAIQFRNDTWPQTNKALKKAKTELEELHKQLDKIANDIQSAGGGA